MTRVEQQDWEGDWAHDAHAKRAAWARTTPAQRLAWLESALDFAASVGALQRDRRRRAELASTWEHDSSAG